MSRIGKKPILLPKETNVKIADGFVLVKGPRGELKKFLDPRIKIEIGSENVFVKPSGSGSDKTTLALWGLYHSLVANMIKGVNTGFEKNLIFQGVGFKAIVKGNGLELFLGFTNPVTIKGAEGILFKVDKNKITVSGIDKELVGQVAATIRKQRKPEPYRGSGIKYENEIIIKKAGKKAAVAAT